VCRLKLSQPRVQIIVIAAEAATCHLNGRQIQRTEERGIDQILALVVCDDADAHAFLQQKPRRCRDCSRFATAEKPADDMDLYGTGSTTPRKVSRSSSLLGMIDEYFSSPLM
jgi:hypothetical protein